MGIQLDPNKPMKDDLPETITPVPPPDQLDGVEPREGTHSGTGTEDKPTNGLRYRGGDDATAIPFGKDLFIFFFASRVYLPQCCLCLDVDPVDSLFIPPSEGFPSITAFFNEDSISLPSFAQQQQHQEVGGNSRKIHRQGVMQPSRRVLSGPQETLTLDPFEVVDPMNDSFDEEFTSLKPPLNPPVARAIPTDPPPPYSEQSPYFSPLMSGWKAPPPASTSTPYQDRDTEEDPTSSNVLRQREKK